MYRRAVYYYVPSAARIQGLDVPIRPLIQIEFGPSFEREDVAALTTAFKATLKKLGLIDRNDPMALTVVKAVTPSQTLHRASTRTYSAMTTARPQPRSTRRSLEW